jgi:hypothetical protein
MEDAALEHYLKKVTEEILTSDGMTRARLEELLADHGEIIEERTMRSSRRMASMAEVQPEGKDQLEVSIHYSFRDNNIGVRRMRDHKVVGFLTEEAARKLADHFYAPPPPKAPEVRSLQDEYDQILLRAASVIVNRR